MKRLISLMLILSLAAIGFSASAEAVSWPGGTTIDENRLSIDLDGDSAEETVWLETVPDDFESFQRLHVAEADGTEAVYDMDIIYRSSAWAGDINHDGIYEIFIWGDVMSDDYYTWCLHYNGDHLVPALFADVDRGENTRGYYKYGYGLLTDVGDECTITLSGSQDVLGTYFMERTLSLTEDGLFECSDDGRWVRDPALFPGDDEYWEFGSLNPATTIPCEIDGAPAELKPGERIIIIGTDKETEASFITIDGRTGTLTLEPDYNRGWGFTVNGISEDELFEEIPYAD